MKRNQGLYTTAKVIAGGVVLAALTFGVGKWLSNSKIALNYIKRESPKEEKQEPVYSNLLDEAVQAEVETVMKEAGIQESAINVFFDWVNDYNSRVEKAEEFEKGFLPLPEFMQADYSDVFLESRYLTNGEMQMDPNCRLTSYLLFNPMVTSDFTFEEEDAYLMFDVYAMEIDPVFETISNQANQFVNLFQPVEVAAESNYEEQADTIFEEWKRRNLKFKKSENLSLITIFLHDNFDNIRFIGHSGVKIKDGDTIWFIEKYSPGMPYQCTKFSSDKQLVDYLLSRKDIYGDGTEERPILFENDQILS